MSAIKNQHEQHDHQHDEFGEDEERRHDSDSKSRDRRVIPRLGHPEIRKSMRHSQTLCTIAVSGSIFYITALIARHVHDSNLELNKSIFLAVVIAIVA
jgi:hypothetical protein